jgi:subtilisin family serine protease
MKIITLCSLIIICFNAALATDIQKIGKQQSHENQIKKRLYIRLKPQTLEARKFLEKILPKDARILDLYKQTAIVEYGSFVDDKDLSKLKSLPEIEKVTLDSVKEIQKETKKVTKKVEKKKKEIKPIDCIDCSKVEVITYKKIEKLEEKIKDVVEVIEDKKCDLYSSCSNNSKTKLWAQLAVDGDLMLEELESLGIKKGSVKVAVLDTGFDVEGNSKNLYSPDITVQKGASFIEGEKLDIIGHGTAVAGLISGKDGIGLSPHSQLSAFAIGYGPKGSSSHSVTMIALEKACDEGNEIINLSYGSGNSKEDKKYFDASLKSDRLFMDMLAKKGCLVLNSAGNQGTKDKEGLKSSLDEAVTRVESSKPNGKMAESSSSGTIRAPGDGVFTLHSTRSNRLRDDWSKKQYGCKDSDGAFISGTSFASPITAAIAANIVSVLKLNEKYKSLPGPDKIKIINRILKASEVADNINGFKAVLIAKEWSANNELAPGPTDRPEVFANLLLRANKDLCEAPVSECTNAQKVCVDKLKCINLIRKKIAICENTSNEVFNRLIKLAENEGNLELMLKTVNVVSNTPNKKFSDTDKIWQSFVQRWSKDKNEFGSNNKDINLRFNMDPEVAGSILTMMAKELKRDPKKDKVFDQALRSYLFSYPLTDGLFSNEVKNNLQNTLIDLIDNLGEDLILNKIKNFIEKASRQEPASLKVKLINFFNEEPLISKISEKDKLINLDKSLFKNLISEDEYVKNQNDYKRFFARLVQNKILDPSADVSENTSYLELGSKIILSDDNSIQDKIALAEKVVLHHLSKANNSVFQVKLIMSSIDEKIKKDGINNLDLMLLKERVATTLKKPENIMKSLDFYPSIYNDVPSYAKAEINKSLFLSLKDACQSSYRIIATIVESESKIWENYHSSKLDNIAYLGEVKDCGIELGSFSIPTELDASSRVAISKKIINGGSTADLLNKLVVKMISAYNVNPRYNYNLYAGLKKILSVESLRSQLTADGEGMKALEELKVKIQSNPGQYRLQHEEFNKLFNMKN